MVATFTRKRNFQRGMESQLRVFRVFLASPSDLADERRAAREIVEGLNTVCSKETNLRIELLGWEDTLPGAGRPQALINADLDKADLFLGCLWQKMGSPAGAGGKTGFEEEFERALAGNQSSGTPEMWLFLKEVDATRRSDPGEQLKRVLEFRKKQEEGKQLLFKEFKDVQSWRELLRDLLLRRVFREIANQPITAKEEQARGSARQEHPATNSAALPKRPSKPGPAFAFLADVVEEAAQKVRAQELLNFDRTGSLSPASTARLLVFAATNYDWNWQHIEFGTHEANSLYLHREAGPLTALERLFLLRTILLDTFGVKPGWYWIQKWNVRTDIWLGYLAIRDSDESMRAAAIRLADRLRFPLNKGAKGKRPINQILKDEKPTVRVAGLEFLASHGVARDESAMRGLLVDQDKDVRIAAERSLRLLHLRTSPELELKRSIRDRDNFDDALLDVLKVVAKQITNDVWLDAVSSQNGALRTFAARELHARDAVTDELARRFILDDALGVRECGYRVLAAQGRSLDFAEIKKALKAPYLSNEPRWNKGDPDVVIQAAFERLPGKEIVQKVIAFNDESAIAVAVIGSKLQANNDVMLEFVGSKLDDLLAKTRASRPPPEPPPPSLNWLSLWGPSDPLEAAKAQIETAALEILADNPSKECRAVFLRYLSTDSSKSSQLIPCLRGLSKVGHPDDRAKLHPFLSSPSKSVEWEAANAYLALSPTIIAAANDLLTSPTKTKVWCVVSHALKAGDEAIWPVLEKLLVDESDDLRRMACYYAIKTQTKKQLMQLLNKYLNQGRYYYNVVVMLDRAVYAPKELALLYVADDEKWAATELGKTPSAMEHILGGS